MLTNLLTTCNHTCRNSFISILFLSSLLISDWHLLKGIYTITFYSFFFRVFHFFILPFLLQIFSYWGLNSWNEIWLWESVSERSYLIFSLWFKSSTKRKQNASYQTASSDFWNVFFFFFCSTQQVNQEISQQIRCGLAQEMQTFCSLSLRTLTTMPKLTPAGMPQTLSRLHWETAESIRVLWAWISQ